ncbi:hypothetical protein CRE_29402 [Caenorhabditis remanei]|uniref:Transmembrane protein 231 n=1 Tax=Caenorhabditis remanei TaxID=31234 RepID=E3NVN3_CAERE|nr:hypothetical protein CRE_29402 [Caenorhabditis remanei]
MPHIEIFRELFQPVYRTYRSSECSWAAFYIKLINIFRYFLPILIIFLTDLYSSGHDRSIISSSYSVLNSAASPDQLSTSQILHHFSDSDSENSALYQKPNRNLNIQFQMSTQNLSINTVIYAFSLKMKLDYHSIIDSELFLTDTIQLPSFPTSQIQTTARLTVDQSVPFQSREKFRIIDRRRQDVEHYQIHSVLRRISESPISWKMERWVSCQKRTTSVFNIHVQKIKYSTVRSLSTTHTISLHLFVNF